jgi:hypothetical protein
MLVVWYASVWSKERRGRMGGARGEDVPAMAKGDEGSQVSLYAMVHLGRSGLA